MRAGSPHGSPIGETKSIAACYGGGGEETGMDPAIWIAILAGVLVSVLLIFSRTQRRQDK
jgi:hypothetical protein